MSADQVLPEPGAMTAPASRRTICFYRHHGIVVTNHQIVINAHRYETSALTGLAHTRGSTHPGVIVGMVIAVAEAVLVALLVAANTRPVTWALAAAALLIPCTVALVCARRWPPRHELLGSYRGNRVTLFTSRDQREFGQVTRAVQRAVETVRRPD